MSTPFDPIVTAGKLWAVIGDGQTIVWIGSGLSTGVYPGLDEFIPDLCSACGVGGGGSGVSFMQAAENCKVANAAVFRTTLGQTYGAPTAITREAYHLLTGLPFRAYVTTNFDPLLAKACRLHPDIPVHKYPDLPILEMGNGRRPAYYIHGGVERPNDPDVQSLVLASSDFEEAYDLRINGFLQEILTSCPIVFLGCRLSEASISAVFQRVKRVMARLEDLNRGRPQPQRFILQAEPFPIPGTIIDRQTQEALDSAASERNRFAELGIETLPYPYDPEHMALEAILGELNDMQESARTLGVGGGPRA